MQNLRFWSFYAERKPSDTYIFVKLLILLKTMQNLRFLRFMLR